MSDAIRNVTIRVGIEQLPVTIQSPNFEPVMSAIQQAEDRIRGLGNVQVITPAQAAEQAAGFESIAQAVQSTDTSLRAQAASLNAAEGAASRNFEAMLNQAQAESVAEQAIRSSTAARQVQSVETIMGTGNALRAAAASGSLSGVVASLGQALVFAARGAAQHSAANAGVAGTAAAAATASTVQAVAIGHVSMAGARAATSNAALAASNVAVATTATLAARAMQLLTASLGPIAIAVAVVSLAVQLGADLWVWWGESSKTAADKVNEAVKQRIDSEREANAVEQAMFDREIKQRGQLLIAIDKQEAALEQLRQTRRLVSELESQSFDRSVGNNAGDLDTQAAMLRQRRSVGGAASTEALISAAQKASKQHFGDLSGTDLAKAERDRLESIKASSDTIQKRLANEEKLKGVLQQQLAIDLQSRDAMKDRLRSIQDQISAEQGRLQSAAERFAQMDPGEQLRLKQISEKAKGGGELSLQEAQFLQQSGVGGGQASQALTRIADKAGFQQIAGNLGEFNQIEQLKFQGQAVSESLAAVEEEARKKSEDIAKSADTIQSLLEVVTTFGSRIIELEPQVEELRRTFLESKQKGR